MPLTEKQRKATTVGAVLGLVSLLLALAVVSAVSAGLGDTVDDTTGTVSETAQVVWSLEDYTSLNGLEQDPVLSQRGCAGLPTWEFFDHGTPSTDAAIIGHGDAINITTPQPLAYCGFPQSAVHTVLFNTRVTAQDLLDGGAEALFVGWVTDDAGVNHTLDARMRLFDPVFDDGDIKGSAITGADYFTVTEGTGDTFEFTPDVIAYFETFPTDQLQIELRATQDDLNLVHDLGVLWNVDITFYGEPVVTSSNTSVATDLFDVFAPSTVLLAGYFAVGSLASVSAILIWPSSETTTITSRIKKGGRK